jgi:hypothetical protein
MSVITIYRQPSRLPRGTSDHYLVSNRELSQDLTRNRQAQRRAMPNITLRFASRLALISLVTSIAAAQGATPAIPPAEQWFSVTISTPEASVRAGSDVKLNVVLTNNTGKDLHSGYGGPGRNGPVFDLDIRDSKNKAVPETPFGLTTQGKNLHPFSGSAFSATSHPGETIKEELNLSKEYDLSKPGKYTVQVRERHPVFQAVKSNIITITVNPRSH